MDTMASQITSLSIVYSTFFSGADQSKKIKVLRHWPFVTGEFPAQMASNAENGDVIMLSMVFWYVPQTPQIGIHITKDLWAHCPSLVKINVVAKLQHAWCRHQMETFSA